MSARGRVRLGRDLDSSWEVVTCALQRGSARRGDARVLDAHGGVIAELLAGRDFAVLLPAGLTAPLSGTDVSACRCTRGGPHRGCLWAHHASGGAVVLVGQCARVVTRALLAVLAGHPRAVYLELADFSVLPPAHRGDWSPLAPRGAGIDLATISPAHLAEKYRAFRATQTRQAAPRRSGGRSGF